jgi:hypothetical protein
MTEFDSRHLLGAALRHTGKSLTCLPGRNAKSGLHEVKELGPALRASLIAQNVPGDRVRLNHTAAIAEWTRAESQVDLVVLASGGDVALAAELKVWDIGHQLFDLAKVCCLIAAGVAHGFLITVAKRDADFARRPGGELFPASEGQTRRHNFLDLIVRQRVEWLRHVGKGGPEPTSVPTEIATTAVAARVSIDAYPGHSARAVEIAVTDPAWNRLVNGWPVSLPPPALPSTQNSATAGS